MCFLNENQNTYLLKLQPEQDFNVTVFFFFFIVAKTCYQKTPYHHVLQLKFNVRSKKHGPFYNLFCKSLSSGGRTSSSHFSSSRSSLFFNSWSVFLSDMKSPSTPRFFSSSNVLRPHSGGTSVSLK